MSTRFDRVTALGWLMLAVTTGALVARHSASGATPASMNCTLLPSSELTDECPICGRPTFAEPLRGTFQLRLVNEGPLSTSYAIEKITCVAGNAAGRLYKICGTGTYTVGGEVAVRQEMTLDLWIDDGLTNRLCHFTNADFAPQRRWPMLMATLDQTNGTFTQVYHLMIATAPFRDIWFSTQNDFHAGIWQSPTNYVSAGDLISWSGRVVKRNQQLTAHLGIMPGLPDLGLDAVDVLPSGEIAFSIETDIFSETLGPLHEGDVLSDQGRVVRSFNELISAFNPEPPVTDPGLDGLQLVSTNEIYFSVETDFQSKKLGRLIRRGDLLSSQGLVVKTNEELIARFAPSDPSKDYGLRGFFVWPSGEIWFATEDGFYGSHFEVYGRGDLLSDQGYVVSRNLDLLSAFQPLEDLADFGLDALHVFTDFGSPPKSAVMSGFSVNRVTGTLTFQWPNTNGFYQLETATNVVGPWWPFSAISGDSTGQEAGALTNHPQAFYRLRQW